MWQFKAFRSAVIRVYKKNENLINATFKFTASFIMFICLISLAMGNVKLWAAIGISIIGAVLATFVTINGFLSITALIIGFFLYHASLETAIMVELFFLTIILFYTRLFPKEGLLIPATVIAFYLKVPYIIPVIAGLYLGITSIIPIGIGTFIYSMTGSIALFTQTAPLADTFKPFDSLENFVKILINMMDAVMENTSWIIYTIIFLIGFIIVRLFSRHKADFSKERSIVLSNIIMLVAFIVAALINIVDINIVSIIIGTAVSIFLALFIKYFDSILDYNKSEKVEFEDEQNYYYVKIVPKSLCSEEKPTCTKLEGIVDAVGEKLDKVVCAAEPKKLEVMNKLDKISEKLEDTTDKAELKTREISGKIEKVSKNTSKKLIVLLKKIKAKPESFFENHSVSNDRSDEEKKSES